jgi:hypothetical protein
MSETFIGRLDAISLDDDDFVVIRDVMGQRIKLAPNAVRALHRELGKFLSLANDSKPLPNPTRADFVDLKKRLEALEQKQKDA